MLSLYRRKREGSECMGALNQVISPTMKPNHSHTVVWPRHIRAGLGLVASAALSVAPVSVAAGESDGGAHNFSALPSPECCPVVSPPVADMELVAPRAEFCQPESNYVAKPMGDFASMNVHTRLLSDPRLRLVIAGLDLVDRELASTPTPTPMPAARFSSTSGDFLPDDRLVDGLRWEWASATWKF